MVSVVPKAISSVEVVSRSSTRLTTMLMPLATAVSAPGLIRSLSPIATPWSLSRSPIVAEVVVRGWAWPPTVRVTSLGVVTEKVRP